MVAALTCNQIEHFNAFQTSYGKELRRSDASLEHMFRRLYAGRGEAEYHAFKTRLANNSSIRSIHDNPSYCHDARHVVRSGADPRQADAGEFRLGDRGFRARPRDSCGMTVAVGFAGLPLVAPKAQSHAHGFARATRAGRSARRMRRRPATEDTNRRFQDRARRKPGPFFLTDGRAPAEKPKGKGRDFVPPFPSFALTDSVSRPDR